MSTLENLTLIEKVALRRFVREALYDDLRISRIEPDKTKSFNEFFPYYEATVRFFIPIMV